MDTDITEGGSAATRQLLGDYATPARFATPMRTPARTPAAAGANRVMQEAQNLLALQAGQTPLLGGENPDLHPSDFSGVTPRAAPAATPNPLAAAAAAVGATPGRSVAGVAATPLLAGAVPATGSRAVAGISATPLLTGATPGRGGGAGLPSATPTPMRDALGLNDPDSLAGAASKREEAARLALQRNELRAGLSQLPAPKNEYQIVVPELPGGSVCTDPAGLFVPALLQPSSGACMARRTAPSLMYGCPFPRNDLSWDARHTPQFALPLHVPAMLQRRRPAATTSKRMQQTGRRGARQRRKPPAWRSCANGPTSCSAACHAPPAWSCCRSRGLTSR